MAHHQQKVFCLSVKDKFPDKFINCDVLDVGSLDINGNNRYLFTDYTYTGIDIGEGANVDIVCKAHEFSTDKQFDLVISTECFEHDMHYHASILNCIKLLKPGGLFLFTCATTGRPEHGTSRSLDWASPFSHIQFNDYYKNLTESDIRKIFKAEDIFDSFEFSDDKFACDLYFWGIKK